MNPNLVEKVRGWLLEMAGPVKQKSIALRLFTPPNAPESDRPEGLPPEPPKLRIWLHRAMYPLLAGFVLKPARILNC
ncbi:MAG: hypothetical protein KDM81_21090, partial [Verrucomicrobiae bacterium]|nr:hypothetical protein [Verrucomicrobiae bacterium]